MYFKRLFGGGGGADASNLGNAQGTSLTLRGAVASSLILAIYAVAGQSGDLLTFFDSSENKIAGVESGGVLYGQDLKLKIGQSGEFSVNEVSVGGNIAFVESEAQVNQFYFDSVTNSLKMKVPDKFFLIAGQSNAQGQGTIDPAIDLGNANIYEFNSIGRFDPGLDPLTNQTHTTNDKMGFGMAFAREYITNNPGETIALVLAAESGTSFGAGDWIKGGDSYNDAVSASNKLVAMGSTFGGILWHQGESDSTVSSSASYANNLLNFVTDLRTDILGDNSQVPFVAGTLADDYLADDTVGFPNANRLEVNNALLAIPTQIDYADFVDLSGLSTIDNIHFNASALRTAGARYYSTLIDTDATSEKMSGGVYLSSKGYVIDGVN